MEKSKKPIEFGNIKDRGLTQEIRTSYLDYAMSVIVSRALPDARDGLKPVQRRILFTMKNLGLGGSAKSKKSAAIVGDTLGKYHPHGDTSVYDALVRMAQTFSLRYPLVKGQGNFGSIDGDSAAAMRYTEAKLTPLADELFDDIDKDTVDFRDNYDGEYKEPTVLPTKVPVLLLNGTTGIAVGMATNIPPHNLTEIMQALLHLSDNPEASLDDLLKFVKGPDFPTAGIAYGGKHIREAYATGRGRVLTRGKMESVEKNGKDMILITEIPYGVNKAEMIKKIASLVETKKIIGIKDLRDESDENIRVVIDLKNGSSPQRIMNQLYKYTDMEKFFYFNCISLVEGGLQPKLLSLKSILEEFISFRKQVITRRTQFLLKKCQDRLHILDGLKTALDAIDEIIKIIKKSENKEDARVQLMKKFKFSEIQANAILEIKLQALAKLERFKIDNEIKEKNDLIKEYESILNSEKKLIKVMKGEFEYIVDKFGDSRKTVIKNILPTEISDMDLIPEKDVLLTISSSGYIKRMNNELFKTQHRGGKGVMMFGSKDSEDVLEKILSVNTKDKLWFFTNKGKVYEALTYDIEESSRTARGKAIQNFINIDTSENINSVLKYSDLENNKFLIMVTRDGVIKKTKIDQFSNIRKTGLLTIRLDKDDSLVKADFSSGDDDIVIVTKKGQAIYMSEKDVRAMGRSAGGVCGIKLAKDDIVIGMGVVRKSDSKSKVALLTVSENGYGKKTYVKDYRYQKRGGVGSRTFHITDKTGELAGAKLVDEHELMFVVSKKGLSIQVELKDVPILSRSTQGVKIMSLNKGDHVSQVEIL